MRLTVTLLVVALCAPDAWARSKKKPTAAEKGEKKVTKGTILINGEKATVNWSDGDSCRILEGPFSGSGTRIAGYNTLESYGPVHRWGDWKAKELYELQKEGAPFLASQEWKCTSDGKLDGYKRLLLECPDAALELVKKGLAHAYAIEDTRADPALLEAQRAAQQKKVGIWAKGVPNGIVTSLHAVGEEGGKSDKAYNRVVDTRTGAALKREHKDRYQVCEEVCVETDGTSSCMVFVPFDRRYKNRADCLKDDAQKTAPNSSPFPL
jgi:endonuclease YncB( thermonuclease family)